MLNDFTGAGKVYIACGYTDLRRGIDGLASMVQQQFQLDPFTNTLFLFCGRRRDRIKALYWEGDGFLLLYKRLESGSFQWPRSEAEAKLLTPQQYPPGDLLLLLTQQFTLPLAHGRPECGTAKGAQAGPRIGKYLRILTRFCTFTAIYGIILP